MLTTEPASSSDQVSAPVELLLISSGFRGPFHFFQLPGGANNKVFCVKEADGNTLVLKHYFHHPSDQRDRAKAEFSFSNFAWENGVCVIPKPYGYDGKSQLGLYEFISGRTVLPTEITEGTVQKASQFIQKLNHYRNLPSAQELPNAAEACFSFAQHLKCVERRLETLRLTEQQSKIDQEAIRFLNGPLTQTWIQTRDTALQNVEKAGFSFHKELSWKDRCLSPSDFGFHNALVTTKNDYRFFDFEYAGWDDPAKLVCDFFCQPALSIPLEYFELFTFHLTSEFSDPDWHLHRIRLLFPIYQVKWCCILLNDFLQSGRDRRRFACGSEDEETRKVKQLEKARRALEQIT